MDFELSPAKSHGCARVDSRDYHDLQMIHEGRYNTGLTQLGWVSLDQCMEGLGS